MEIKECYEALKYLSEILGLNNYPNGTEDDLRKDDKAFGYLILLFKAIDRLDFVEKQFNILDIALDNYIAKNLGLTKNELGTYGSDNYSKILEVRKDLIKMARKELESEK